MRIFFYRKRMRLRNFCVNFLLFLASIFFVLLCLEFYFRTTRLDARLLKESLYYEDSSISRLYQSADAVALYSLKPNAQIDIDAGYKKIHMSINDAGFRNDFEVRSQTDKYRIVMIGGSNTFGFNVDDSETYAAFMQKEFEEKYPGRVEVINAGIPAYVATQKLAYARKIIAEYNPNMLIIQNYNSGRRAFLQDDVKIPDFLYQDKELFAESIPFLFSDNVFVQKMHYRLVYASAAYRVLLSRLNLLGIVLSYNFSMSASAHSDTLVESGEVFTKADDVSPAMQGLLSSLKFLNLYKSHLSDRLIYGTEKQRRFFDVIYKICSVFLAAVQRSDFSENEKALHTLIGNDPFLFLLKQILILNVAPANGFVFDISEDRKSFVDKFNMATWLRGEVNNKKVWEEFLDDYGAKLPLLIFYPAEKNSYRKNIIIKREGYYRMKFALGDKPDQYTHLHPQGHVYKWYSAKMVKLLDSFVRKRKSEAFINDHYFVVD